MYYTGKKYFCCIKATRRQGEKYRKSRRESSPHQHLRRREQIATGKENNEKEQYEERAASGRTDERITDERRVG